MWRGSDRCHVQLHVARALGVEAGRRDPAYAAGVMKRQREEQA